MALTILPNLHHARRLYLRSIQPEPTGNRDDIHPFTSHHQEIAPGGNRAEYRG